MKHESYARPHSRMNIAEFPQISITLKSAYTSQMGTRHSQCVVIAYVNGAFCQEVIETEIQGYVPPKRRPEGTQFCSIVPGG